MITFGNICKWIKEQDKELDFVIIHDLPNFATQETITTKGIYKMQLEFNAKEMLKNPNSIPARRSDFIYRPFLLLLKFKESPSHKKKKK